MAEIPLVGKRDLEDGPVIRLLYCLVCSTIEELPMHHGPVETDVLLEISVERHKFPSGEPHKGKLFILPVKTWSDAKQKKAIIEQLKGGGAGGLADLDPNYYDTKMTFHEDALKCWESHGRPGDKAIGCTDYQDESKRLLPDTVKERKEMGLPSAAESALKVYLCQFCPYQQRVIETQRFKSGGQ
jgi:hypothetical protein